MSTSGETFSLIPSRFLVQGGVVCETCAQPKFRMHSCQFVCRPKDFLEGYKAFCYGYYNHYEVHKDMFWQSKLGSIIWRQHLALPQTNCQSSQRTFTDVLLLVEIYLKNELGEDVSNLRLLMTKYDDIQELRSHEYGQMMLEMIESDDTEIEHLSKRQ